MEAEETYRDRGAMIKIIYGLIISQQIIPWKEITYNEGNGNSRYSKIYLEFQCGDLEIQILKKARINAKDSTDRIGEEQYILCSPMHQRAPGVKRLLDYIIEFPLRKLKVNKEIENDDSESKHTIQSAPPPEIEKERESIPDISSAPVYSTTPSLEEKQCVRKECLKMKPLCEFYKGSGSYGRQSYCKECVSALSKISRQKQNAREIKIEKIQETPPAPVPVEPEIILTETQTAPLEILASSLGITEKQCGHPDCREMKPLSQFSRSTEHGYAFYCRDCAKEASAKSREKKRLEQGLPAKPAKPAKHKNEYAKTKYTPTAKEKLTDHDKSKALDEFKRNNVLKFLNL